ncbi:hypothetical protein O181_039802 [Austropuccinia psidii MF-1]|uniref:Reverse transcriptase Ty1/copia-type domain-containing protein n=1 Tax=Austropuccinia psidii MF-1 TaxID=1389203 RepID=A0A9Q3DHI0_9BASI|nr:hypothetical protein [Austropuccinia psidii MF-1]
MTIEETSNDSVHQENPSNIKSISDREDDDIFVDALKKQPQRIRVIGPRHPTLISSKINSNNILPFPQRQPRVNLTDLINHTPKQCPVQIKEIGNLQYTKNFSTSITLMYGLFEKKENNHPITSTWLFKEKMDDSGKTIEYKACLCAHGFNQIAGLDYQSTFAPTGRLSSLHALISFAAIKKYKFHQMDM